jgi:hypothetical protein
MPMPVTYWLAGEILDLPDIAYKVIHNFCEIMLDKFAAKTKTPRQGPKSRPTNLSYPQCEHDGYNTVGHRLLRVK